MQNCEYIKWSFADIHLRTPCSDRVDFVLDKGPGDFEPKPKRRRAPVDRNCPIETCALEFSSVPEKLEHIEKEHPFMK